MRTTRGLALLAGVGTLYFAPYLRSLKTFAVSDGIMRIFRRHDSKSVAVTFDDGPHPLGTPMVLDRLDELNWKATFFLVGEKVEAHPELVREIIKRGHRVGVHGYSHRSMLWLTPRQTWQELSRCKTAIEDASGNSPTIFRPPYGELSWLSIVVAKRLGLSIELWSAWGRDWKLEATPKSIVQTVSKGDLRGGTVLLHDSDSRSSTGNWEATSESLEQLSELFAALDLSVKQAS